MIFFLLLIFLLFSCEHSEPTPITSFADTAMTMNYRILIGKPLTSAEKKQVQDLINETFSDIDDLVNKWNPQSEISHLNRAKGGESIPLSSELAHFLRETEHIVQWSGGRFDPTIEPLYQLWKSKLERGQIPSSSEVQTVAGATGWKNIHLKDDIFWKDFDATQLDLGGIAKGYAIDLLVERLKEQGCDDIYVEWGGEIRTSGKHPEGRPWRVLVSKFGHLDPSNALAIVDLENEAIASSGDYVQNWTVDGVTFYHLINPETHSPLVAGGKTVCCATVAAPTCMIADALATAAMMFPSPEKSREWLQEQQNTIPTLKYWVLSRNGD